MNKQVQPAPTSLVTPRPAATTCVPVDSRLAFRLRESVGTTDRIIHQPTREKLDAVRAITCSNALALAPIQIPWETLVSSRSPLAHGSRQTATGDGAGMDRGMAPRRQERSRRGDAVTARLVRTLPVAAAAASSTSSWNNPWLVENWGLIIMAAMTVATVAFSTGTSTPGTMSTSTRGGHQSLFASPTSRGGISIARAGQQPSSPWRRGRALQEGNADDVGSPIVEYETKLQLFMCNPDLAEEGSGGYLVDETSLAAALSRVTGLRQVKFVSRSGPQQTCFFRYPQTPLKPLDSQTLPGFTDLSIRVQRCGLSMTTAVDRSCLWAVT